MKITLTVILIMIFCRPLFAEGLASLIELGRNMDEMAKIERQETDNFDKVDKATKNKFIKIGQPKDLVRKEYGDPVIELKDGANGFETWIYKAAASNYFKGTKIYLVFNSEGLLNDIKVLDQK